MSLLRYALTVERGRSSRTAVCCFCSVGAFDSLVELRVDGASVDAFRGGVTVVLNVASE